MKTVAEELQQRYPHANLIVENRAIGGFVARKLIQTPYLKALLDGQPSLERRFAQIDAQLVRTEMLAAQQPPEKIPGKMHRLIATPDFPEIFVGLLRKVA